MQYRGKRNRAIGLLTVISLILLFFGGSPTIQAEDNRIPVENFVKRLYNIALNREADSGGLEHYTERLMQQRYTGAQVVHYFLNDAPEFERRKLSDSQFLDLAYAAIFDRQPDAEGKAFWLDRLIKDYSRRWVIANMIGCPEFDNMCKAAGIKTGNIGTRKADLPTVNKYGNLKGNINSLGFTAVQGNWIYYTNSVGAQSDGYLYKMRRDDTTKTKLNNDVSFYINVLGDWIYYSNLSDNGRIYKIMVDGSGRAKVCDDTATNIYVTGGWIYYLNGSDGDRIYKIKTDGTQRTRISTDMSWDFQVEGNQIYYINVDDANSLYKIGTDGSGKTKLTGDKVTFVNVSNGWIYYSNASDNGKLYRIKADKTGRTRLNNDESLFVVVDGDWVYYSLGGKPYKVKKNGTERQPIYSKSNEASLDIGFFNIIDDSIYMFNFAGGNKVMARMKIDGTEYMTLK